MQMCVVCGLQKLISSQFATLGRLASVISLKHLVKRSVKLEYLAHEIMVFFSFRAG